MGLLLIALGVGTVLVSRDAASTVPMQVLTALVGLGIAAYGLRIELDSEWY